MNLKQFHPSKILIINPFGIGDVLFTIPLVRNLKLSYPESFIGYLCNRRTAEFLNNYPKIDRVFIYERDEFHLFYRKSKWNFMREGFGFLRQIRRADFDLVIDLSLNGTMNFLTALIGIPHRVGFNYKGRSPFLTKKIPLEGYQNKHVAEYYLSLLEIFGHEAKIKELEFPLQEKDRQWAQEFFKKQGISTGDVVVGLVPGGGASWGKEAVYKRWPPEKYAKLADKIVEKFSAKIILMGNQNEAKLCQTVASTMRNPACLSTESTIGQFAALLKSCRLNVVNDGGPLHVAVAAGAKTVSIFGPVDEIVYGPYGALANHHLVVTKEIACRPCYRKFRRAECHHISCLGLIDVEEVLEKVVMLLGRL